MNAGSIFLWTALISQYNACVFGGFICIGVYNAYRTWALSNSAILLLPVKQKFEYQDGGFRYLHRHSRSNTTDLLV